MAELKIRERELEINITELSKKNVELERINAELKERLSTYEGKFKEHCVQNAGTGKESEKKVTTPASKCLSMDNLKENKKFVKFYTGLPDYDTLKAVFDLACKCLLSTTQHGLHKLTNDDVFF